jgi:hypothetical protein
MLKYAVIFLINSLVERFNPAEALPDWSWTGRGGAPGSNGATPCQIDLLVLNSKMS